MNQRFKPYHLCLLLLLGVVSMVSFLKINKHNFYHHYFRVIEDVEGRNSQALTGSSIQDFTFESPAQTLGNHIAKTFAKPSQYVGRLKAMVISTIDGHQYFAEIHRAWHQFLFFIAPTRAP